MTKPCIFLTGGSGMVGRNILEHQLANSYQIIAPSSKELDLTNASQTFDFIKKIKPDIIIHAAGRVGGIQANIANPVEFLITNIDLGRNVILSAHKLRVPTILNLASSCIYPRNAPNPLKESQILQGELEPTNEGYALAKIFTTRLCQYINKENKENNENKIQFKTIIPCNLYGRFDKFDPRHSHLIPAIIHKIHLAKKNNSKVVEIWGDGTANREFMYASDLADAIFKALIDLNELPDILNIGIGYDHSIKEYYEMAAKVIDWHGKFQYDTSKPIGMKKKLVDISLQKKWGWMPETSLESGIKNTYKYYLESQTI